MALPEDDAWSQAWDDGEQGPDEKKKQKPASLLQNDEDDDDDAGAWGLDEDLDLDDGEDEEEEKDITTAEQSHAQAEERTPTPPPPPPRPTEHAPANDEDMDAWGDWDDDDASSSTSKPANITLTESYTITSIPSHILQLTTQLLHESTLLSTSYNSTIIASSAPGLQKAPSQLLALFRALAPLSYSGDHRANMYLYNDAHYLSEQLSALPNYPHPLDIAQLAAFGKRAYKREMEVQRTILLDYLDSAQGFVACTEYPQSEAVDTAVDSILAHLGELEKTWRDVLSKSALFQTVGSLLNTVVTKFVNDVEDLGDISEPESVKLARICALVAESMEPLFMPEGGSGAGQEEEKVPLTAVYCTNWLKFRYLEQILESPLPDIMGLWREGLLGDFEKDELVELIRALYADTENRRRCVDEIRRR